jgi:hypothetical protein
VSLFSPPQTTPSTHHELTTNHHIRTIEKPRSKHRFPQNPQQKHPNPQNKKLQPANQFCAKAGEEAQHGEDHEK